MQKISFVIPCYRSENTIADIVKRIKDTMGASTIYSTEIVLVSDGSPDGVFDVIKSLCREDSTVKGINLSKNFGQQSAIMAGLSHANGDIIICLDDDGQTPPEEAYKLLCKLDEGYDVVYARYSQKHHSPFRNWGSKVNGIMAEHMMNKPKDIYISSYFAMKRFVVEDVLKYTNAFPYIEGLIFRTTQNIADVLVSHCDRLDGASGYTLVKLITLWFNGFTAFSIKPLRISTFLGTILAFSGFLYGAYTIVDKILHPLDVLLGYSSMMAALLFIGGMILLMLGMIGEYIGRIYISINNSPQYVIRDAINFDSFKSPENNTDTML